MKAFPVLLSLSVAANVALLALVATGVSRRAPADSVAAPAAAKPAASPVIDRDATWVTLEHLDLAGQRDRLRAAGFPPAVIRAILAAQIHESFAARRKALEVALGNSPFWKSPRPDPATAAAARALDKEEQNALRDLLGHDADAATAAALQRQFPGFSPAQVDELVAIRQRYSDQRQAMYEAMRPGPGMTYTPDERAKLTALEKAMHDEFATVLTPAQLEDYDLRTSNVANNLRFNLGNFELTENEFRAVYHLQAAFDDQWGSSSGPGATPDERRAYSEARTKLGNDIAAALGPDRNTQYQRATDYNYRQASQLVARLNLPPETADTLYAVQKEYDQRRTDIYRTVTSPAERDAAMQQLTALQQEATARVTPLLGGSATAVEAYKRYGGQWLVNLAPRVAAPRPAPPKP